jgi:hypothetical protein
MSDILDLYDHEVKAVIELLAELNERAQAKQHNYGDFEREIRDRFAKLGFTVDVNWYEYALGEKKQDGAMPEITVTGRTDDKFQFDPDRQVHEAVHNVLELPGEEGWISTDPDTLKRFTEGQGGHGHDHGHHSH